MKEFLLTLLHLAVMTAKPTDRQASTVCISKLDPLLTQLGRRARFSSIKYAIACRSRRSNQPVRTANTRWRANASITAGVYITKQRWAVWATSAELWDSTGLATERGLFRITRPTRIPGFLIHRSTVRSLGPRSRIAFSPAPCDEIENVILVTLRSVKPPVGGRSSGIATLKNAHRRRGDAKPNSNAQPTDHNSAA